MKNRITVKQLGTALENDKYYNGEALFPCTVNENQRIMEEVMKSLKHDDKGQIGFIEWYHNLPNSNPHAIAFAAILCTEIDKYLSGTEEKISWRYDGFSETFRDNLEVVIGDLKLHFRKFNYPLPAEIFPECNDNTKVRIHLYAVKFDPKYSMYPNINALGQKITDLLEKSTQSKEEREYKQKTIDTLWGEWEESKEIADFEDVTHPLELDLQWSRGEGYYWNSADQEKWPLLFAILFISRCEKDDKKTFLWWRKSLLYKTSLNTGWEEKVGLIRDEAGTFVDPLKWLKWCKTEGFNAPKILWDFANRQDAYRKLIVVCNQNKELEPANIDHILELDEALNQYKLLGECYKVISIFNENSQGLATGNNIVSAIIRKGELLQEIAERESIQCLSQADIDCRNAAIKQSRQDILEINKNIENIIHKQPTKGLAVFRIMSNLTASSVTIRLLRKDDQSQPDRVEISAHNHCRTVFCTDFGLIDKRTGLLNRAGKMLLALANGTRPNDIEAPEQAMKELRKIFRALGIMDKDSFYPKSAGWQPRFNLLDAIKQADKRAADRVQHIQFDDQHYYAHDDDEGGIWLQEHDKISRS